VGVAVHAAGRGDGLGPVKVVPPRAWRPCGGSTWTAPALRRLHGS